MSRNLDSRVQTQMAVAVFKTPLTGATNMEGKQHKHQHLQRQSSGRRVFVQTETGCVFGMELYRSIINISIFMDRLVSGTTLLIKHHDDH